MRNYMAALKARGDLLEVHREVDPKHELAAVTHAAQQRWGKAILFHKVKGTDFPVLTNIYGSRDRLAELIGIKAEDFCRQWSNLASLGAAPAKATLSEPDDGLIEKKLSDLPLITYSERDEVIRALQRRLASHVAQDTLPVGADNIDVFVASLSTAWTSGETRPDRRIGRGRRKR